MSDDVKAQRADEVFDVVNAADEVIGQATRAEVHARGLWHRAVHVLVFNSRGQVFLVDVADEDSKGGSLPGGCIYRVEEGDFEVKCFQWRPAALAAVEVHQ